MMYIQKILNQNDYAESVLNSKSLSNNTKEKLLLDIKNYLYQFSMQKPELFKQLQLPSPRTI